MAQISPIKNIGVLQKCLYLPVVCLSMPLCDMDVHILQVLNSCSFLDPLMITLSVVGDLYLWVVIGVLVFWFNGKNVAISYGVVLFITWLIVVLRCGCDELVR